MKVAFEGVKVSGMTLSAQTFEIFEAKKGQGMCMFSLDLMRQYLESNIPLVFTPTRLHSRYVCFDQREFMRLLEGDG